MKKTITISLAVLLAMFLQKLPVMAQSDTIKSLSFSGYAELYYAYDFGKPGDHNRPGFVYSHNRHNEVNLNLGYFKIAYEHVNIRANMALMAGTYANANLAAEPGVLKNIFEVNAGFRLSKHSDTWLDAGIFPSHIGFESAVGKDCRTLTRSMMADNSPYYESGVKVSHTNADGSWFLSALLLNGWQRIQRPDGNHTPAFGTQVTYQPGAALTLNSSTFIGNDKPDSLRQMRYFHNFYGTFQFHEKWSATLGFDAGAEQTEKSSRRYHTWYATALILTCRLAPKWSAAGRVEYFADQHGVIISPGLANGFKTLGWSLNFDFDIRENLLWRIEGRGLHGEQDVFVQKGKLTNRNFSAATALAFQF